MSQYKTYLHHYAPGSHSTHHHYHADTSYFDRSRPSSLRPTQFDDPPPHTSPPHGLRSRRPAPPQPDPGPGPKLHNRGVYEARQYRCIIEYRTPSRYHVFGDQLADSSERCDGWGVALPRWFWDAGRGGGRRRAGSIADRVHAGMARNSEERWGYHDERFGEIRRGSTGSRARERCEGYSDGVGYGYGRGYQHCGEDVESQQRYVSDKDIETDADARLRSCLWRGERIRERRGRPEGMEFQVEDDTGTEASSEVTSRGDEWQRSVLRKYAENQALRKFVQKTVQSRNKKGEYIRLRDGQKAWVRPKKSKCKKVRRYKGLGGW